MSIRIPTNINPESIRALQAVVSDARAYLVSQNRRPNSNIELEIRLGNLGTNFNTDVGENAWVRILSAMNASPDWKKKEDNYEMIDFYYSVDEGEGKRQIRTSRYIKNGQLVVEHTEKIKKNSCTFSLEGAPTISTGVRMVFNTESMVSLDHLPDITCTDRVRIKHRQSFFWGSWRFDMTRVWMADTYSAAVRKRDDKLKNHSTYEVEIEVIDANTYFSRKFHSDEYIAMSMFLKIIGLLPQNIKIGY
jgi:hypothetical protein